MTADRDNAGREETSRPVLSVQGLTIQVATPEGPKPVVQDLSFDLRRGETLCLAGESGSGKSMTALAIMGLLPQPMARIASGSIRLADGSELAGRGERDFRDIRANRISMIFQEPMTSLNPVMTIGRQLTEVLLEHRACTPAEAPSRALDLLRDVRITDAETRLKQYPHELSGGMRQRVMIAIALACNPEILIADEPTTALDVTVQAEVLELIRVLQREHGTTVLMITHDMGVVAEMADRVIVLRHGRQEETAPVRNLFAAPQTEYSQELLDAVPRLGQAPARPAPERSRDVVDVAELCVRFPMRGGLLNRVTAQVHAVEGVSFRISPGETLALVGESGCGKSTIGRALLGLVPWQGSIRIDGQQTAGLSPKGLKPIRRDIQMVFQDPGASLDARMTVGHQVAEPLVIHGLASGSELWDRVEMLFRRVGLTPDQMDRYPHEFSGGQRQRICIARALALGPKVIVADESVSALDVSVQAQVLDLLRELQEEEGLAYLFISHDMAVIDQVADRVAVMNLGQIVETGSRDQVLRDPAHGYTRRLLSAVPIPDPEHTRPPVLPREGEVGSPVWPLGQGPARLPMAEIAPGHWVAQGAPLKVA
ncbi:ABC transporter ATP-binding protein [Rhodovulum adriaticum]|uniref:Peptide/nickel transport system ATP-binding protein n=1 Tax=Rhodovulum adriaticum TaxID=35804 RepID=A0A4R2NLP2_RHOAD|nr:ABC transporter ATP-binding protein [Rhodovulum adriaticum]MBK1636487.1 ABC transporter ATP-binding protein [Rhodovulum adriaticum]TCP22205.1 peptide/nickel transport system ATP-binding protein [Rhodovulum adriaticum]